MGYGATFEDSGSRRVVPCDESGQWRERIQSGCGGRRLREQRAALIEYTEEPIGQGRLESPWEGLVGGVVLGDAAEAEARLKGAGRDPAAEAEARRVAAARGIRRFWRRAEERPELAQFARRLRARLSIVNV